MEAMGGDLREMQRVPLELATGQRTLIWENTDELQDIRLDWHLRPQPILGVTSPSPLAPEPVLEPLARQKKTEDLRLDRLVFSEPGTPNPANAR
jgi:hypothetical protein